ncbi:T9SS type A sorting domain-containing protein [Flavobacterium ponti]|uniref:T9SS type A sorting domain-containing protein n=1 Tax=Flavobacterium ponti TaxID=665133 RepID=A0ABV9P1N1_9FLAO
MKKILLLLLFITGTLYAQPPIAQPNDLIVCDDMSNDGIEAFDLTINETQTLNGLNPANYTITYHLDQAGADANSNLASPPNSFVGGPNQTIFIRVEEISSGLYSTTSFNLIVNPLPAVLQPNDIIVYENPFDGSATFDLTQNETIMTNGATGLSFQYYLTLADAQAGTNAIPNQSTFTNTSNPQTIFVSVVDNTTGCFSITNFDLVVLDSSQVIYFPDANLKAALVSANSSNSIALTSSGYGAVDTNSDGEIQFTEALAITGIQLQSFGITDLTGIQYFDNITFFGSYHNSINNFSILNGLQQLQNINVTYNTGSVTAFNFSNLPALTNFSMTYSNITSLVLDNLSNIITLNIWGNTNLSSLDLLALTSLNKISAFDSNVSTLSITNSPVLTEIDFTNNDLNSIIIANFPLLKILKLSANNISDTSNFTNINNIEEINIQNNQITNLILPTSLPVLKYLYCGSNGFSNINISGYPSLLNFTVNNNNISNLDFSNTPLIQQLNISNNPIATIDFSNLSNLTTISCSSNTMTELDFSNNPNLMNLSYFNNTNLTNVNLKSGTINTINYNSSSYYNLPNLMYVCIDEGDTFTYNNLSVTPNVQVGSYCSFTPGGNYNTITGITQFDLNGNGCDVNDIPVQYFGIGINLNATATNSSVFSNGLGNYSIFTNQIGTFDLIPNLENPNYFNVNPNPASVNIPVIDNSTTTQNFCVTANGVHPDLEIVIAPIIPARPGFDAVYKIVYRNKGNQTVDGYVNFTFNDAVLDFVSSSVTPNNNSGGFINWFFPGLVPFETGSILVTLNVNSPTETPAVNIGDILAFNAFIDVTTDDNWADNNFDFNQTVVGSYDPNDITCIEGDVVSPSYIGEYLHYVINFENTGTYQAENIVVKTEINPADFDISTLRLLEASHNVSTRINGNIIEFIFQTINLDTGGHGNVLLKLQTKDNLLISDMVTNKADIYFDYNFPVETNFANTTFQVLSNSIVTNDNSVGIYPNPAKDNVNIKANSAITSIEVYDAQGRIVQKRITNVDNENLDVSNLTKGIYFLMIKTELGQKVEKLVKE